MSEDLEQNAEKENFGVLLVIFRKLKWLFSILGSICAAIVWSFFIFFVAIIENMGGYKRSKRNDEKMFWQQAYNFLRDMGLSEDNATRLIREKQKEVRLDDTFYYQRPQDVAKHMMQADPNFWSVKKNT